MYVFPQSHGRSSGALGNSWQYDAQYLHQARKVGHPPCGEAVRHIKILALLNQNRSGNLVPVVQASYPDYDKEAIYYIMDDLRSNAMLPAKPPMYDEDLSANFNQLTKMGEKFAGFITL
jgi:hypothetical protein